MPNLFYLRLVIGIAAYGLLRAALPVLGYSAEIRRATAVVALSLIVLSFQAFRVSVEVRLRMGWVAMADVIEAVTMVVGVVVLARTHARLDAFLWLYVAANTLNLALIGVRGVRIAAFDWRIRTSAWFPMIRAAVPLGVASLVITLYYRLDVVILARIRSADAVGQYGTAYRFLEAFVVLAGLLLTVLNPVLSRSFVAGREVLRRRFASIVHLVAIPALFVAVAGAMTAWRVLPALPGFAKFGGA